MPPKNDKSNEEQNQKGINELQVSEAQIGENQRGNSAVIEDALKDVRTDSCPTIASPNIFTEKDAGELTPKKTTVHIPQTEGEKPARLGPTGPRTEGGKQRSSRNALKFGIFSKAILLKGESRSEYRSLLERFWKSLLPVGGVEELLVEKLASIIWRYRRWLAAEGAVILKNSESVDSERSWRVQLEAEEIYLKLHTGSLCDLGLEPGGLIWKIHNSDVLKGCIILLAAVLQGIQTDGFNKDRDGSRLETIYGVPVRPHFRRTLYDGYLHWHDIARATEEERRDKGYPKPERCEQNVVLEIEAEIAWLKQYQEKHECIESERRKLEVLRHGVPDSRELDTLLRYVSTLERDFDRTLTQLERLQRMRKGQPVLPPIKLDIAS